MFHTISAIKAANTAAGQFFFDPDTLAFFQSRVSRKLYGGRFLVTSELNRWDPQARRVYTIREAMPDGSIETVGEFGQFSSRARAHREAERLAMGRWYGEDAGVH